jgi:CO/xanthine dehydrogenase Mo-binding subunit
LDPDTGQGIGSVHWHQGAASCEVEVDTETGKIKVLKLHASAFAGRMVNPRLCELQIEGSSFFGLGHALFEEALYDNGKVINPNLSDYMVPSFQELTDEMGVAVVEHPGAGEIHGLGETTLPPVMPAIASAVFNAVGVRITNLPLTAEKVLDALQARRS